MRDVDTHDRASENQRNLARRCEYLDDGQEDSSKEEGLGEIGGDREVFNGERLCITVPHVVQLKRHAHAKSHSFVKVGWLSGIQLGACHGSKQRTFDGSWERLSDTPMAIQLAEVVSPARVSGWAKMTGY